MPVQTHLYKSKCMLTPTPPSFVSAFHHPILDVCPGLGDVLCWLFGMATQRPVANDEKTSQIEVPGSWRTLIGWEGYSRGFVNEASQLGWISLKCTQQIFQRLPDHVCKMLVCPEQLMEVSWMLKESFDYICLHAFGLQRGSDVRMCVYDVLNACDVGEVHISLQRKEQWLRTYGIYPIRLTPNDFFCSPPNTLAGSKGNEQLIIKKT